MTFDKWLGKSRNKKREHRKQYYGSKSFDCTCRNHGGCDWCEENRKYSYIKEQQKADDKIKEYINSEE